MSSSLLLCNFNGFIFSFGGELIKNILPFFNLKCFRFDLFLVFMSVRYFSTCSRLAKVSMYRRCTNVYSGPRRGEKTIILTLTFPINSLRN